MRTPVYHATALQRQQGRDADACAVREPDVCHGRPVAASPFHRPHPSLPLIFAASSIFSLLFTRRSRSLLSSRTHRGERERERESRCRTWRNIAMRRYDTAVSGRRSLSLLSFLDPGSRGPSAPRDPSLLPLGYGGGSSLLQVFQKQFDRLLPDNLSPSQQAPPGP